MAGYNAKIVNLLSINFQSRYKQFKIQKWNYQIKFYKDLWKNNQRNLINLKGIINNEQFNIWNYQAGCREKR